ncbi:MAG: cell division protein ZapA [Desulfovibrio sp.]|nr:cell division protein ZapA [Desulfovibrio sp.]
MESPSQVLTVLGVDILFRSGANLERARQAAKLVEDLFAKEMAKRSAAGGQTKDSVILTFLALGLADDLLQTKSKVEALQQGIATTLEKIEKFE